MNHGKLVNEKEKVLKEHSLDVQSLPSGLYFLNIHPDGNGANK
jgi:hypothetical protein